MNTSKFVRILLLQDLKRAIMSDIFDGLNLKSLDELKAEVDAEIERLKKQ